MERSEMSPVGNLTDNGIGQPSSDFFVDINSTKLPPP
jgi:hypothetical protein